jgi:hypothetical protein
MLNTQAMFSVGVCILLFMAIAGTGYSAKKLLTQDASNPLPDTMVRTFWSVPMAIWSVYALARWSMCW